MCLVVRTVHLFEALKKNGQPSIFITCIDPAHANKKNCFPTGKTTCRNRTTVARCDLMGPLSSIKIRVGLPKPSRTAFRPQMETEIRLKSQRGARKSRQSAKDDVHNKGRLKKTRQGNEGAGLLYLIFQIIQLLNLNLLNDDRSHVVYWADVSSPRHGQRAVHIIFTVSQYIRH